MIEKLESCPFCGGEIRIRVTDIEGNHRPDEYENEPLSGLGYVLQHNAGESGCPIATFEGETLGIYMYGSREEAIEAWNLRSKEGK